ncbi:MAG: hypothetical protein M0R06_00130 [Sphaerochaeta sp.]|jgi:hypothetical protein|nr:hypothetical protein [Sphaerochaeta sp.]
MKIITRCVIDIKSLETLEEESFEYNGPIGGCLDFGSTTTESTSVDTNYNAIIASLMSEEFGIFKEMYNTYKYGTQTGANDVQLTKEQQTLKRMADSGDMASALKWKKLVSQNNWTVDPATGNVTTPTFSGISQQKLEEQQLQGEYELLPMQLDLEKQKLQSDLQLMPGMTKAKQSLVDMANQGVDVKSRMDRAQADVEQAAGIASKSARNLAFRENIDPTSGAYMDMQRGLLMDKTRGIAGARTAARDVAEDETFERLSKIAQM